MWCFEDAIFTENRNVMNWWSCWFSWERTIFFFSPSRKRNMNPRKRRICYGFWSSQRWWSIITSLMCPFRCWQLSFYRFEKNVFLCIVLINSFVKRIIPAKHIRSRAHLSHIPRIDRKRFWAVSCPANLAGSRWREGHCAIVQWGKKIDCEQLLQAAWKLKVW